MGCCLSVRIKANESPLSSGAAETPARGGGGGGGGGGGAGDTKIEISSTVTNNDNNPSPRTEGEILELSNLKSFTYQELKACTRNFQPDSLIGEGGFGCVYKGWVDKQTFDPAKPGTGLVVAVKRLNQDSFQGHQEWLAEIKYLSQLHHINLVKLIGYNLEDEHRLLVYEFMRRRSLEHLLFTRSAYHNPLSWRLRMKIALGAARGLALLHSRSIKVIYRDFKPANILIDSDYTAKLSDFGLAKDGPTSDNQKSYVSTRVLGTHGYAAPEYLATGHLSTRSDIYSFGVVLLELLSGKRVFDSNRHRKEQDLVGWASPYLRSTNRKKFFHIIDTRIQGRYPHNGADRLGKLTLLCLSVDPRFRPTMKEVVAELEQLQLRELNDD